MTSNLEMSGGFRLICEVKVASSRSSKRPRIGFAAARMAHRVFKEALIPALEMEMRCCSIASCMADRSLSFILSNSSMGAKALIGEHQGSSLEGPATIGGGVLHRCGCEPCRRSAHPRCESASPVDVRHEGQDL